MYWEVDHGSQENSTESFSATVGARTGSGSPAVGSQSPAFRSTCPTEPVVCGAAGRDSVPTYFHGPSSEMIAFPLGGVAAGSISLGGRGQLRDWEIFNRPDKGASPAYAFPSIWVQTGKDTPLARVLESLGRGGICGYQSGAARKVYRPLRRRASREHIAGRGEGRCQRKPFHPRHNNP